MASDISKKLIVFRLVFGILIVMVSLLSTFPVDTEAHFGSDKLGHFFAYAMLMIWGSVAFPHRRNIWPVACFLVGLGALLEVVQSLIPSRTADWLDLAANFAGVAVGAAIYPVTIAIGRILRFVD